MAPSSWLTELIASRLRGLGREQRRLLEALAFGEPLGPAEMTPWGGPTVEEELESRGLLVSRTSGRRLQFWLAHPLYGDVLRAQVSPARGREITLALAECAQAVGMRRRQDLLRVATWRLAAGAPEGQLMLEAAQMARWRYDFELAERFADAAAHAGGGFDADLLVAELASLRGRPDDAERRYATLADGAETEDQRAQVAAGRLNNLTFGLADWDTGMRIAAETRAAVRDPRLIQELIARAAGLGLAAQGPRAAIEAAEPLLAKTEGPAFVWTCLVLTFSFGRLGRIEDALGVAQRGQSAQEHLAEPMDWYPWFHVFGRCEALAAAGRFTEAEQLAMEHYQAGLRNKSDEARVFFAWHLSRNWCERGHVDRAVRYGRESVALFRKLGRRGHLQSALEDLALAHSLRGESLEVAAVLDSLDAKSPQWLGTNAMIARAWASVIAGDVRAGRVLLHDAAALGERSGDLVGATTALHCLARLGQPGDVVEMLGNLAGKMQGALPAARAEHVLALLEADPDRLAEVGATFEAMGADLLAAEAHADAAVAHQRRGDVRRATAERRRSDVIRRRCGPVRTPALQPMLARAQLTPAERETAMMAAAGRTDREIADLLHLSPRTIENRLYHTYRKLRIAGRDQLTEALEQLD